MTPLRRNRCRSVRRYKETRRERFLVPEEYRKLGGLLDAVLAGAGPDRSAAGLSRRRAAK